VTEDNINARNTQYNPNSNKIKNNSQELRNTNNQNNQYPKKTSYLLGLSSYPTKVK
jgi:hypothetical protein